MPRTAKDEADEKMPKPKVLFKMNFEILDNGEVDASLFERFENEKTGRWKTRTCDTSDDFQQAVKEEICEKPKYIGCEVLNALGIDPQVFARKVLNVPQPDFSDTDNEELEEDGVFE